MAEVLDQVWLCPAAEEIEGPFILSFPSIPYAGSIISLGHRI